MTPLFFSLRRRLLPWHRRLAILIALPVLAWALTGLLHPVMSRWQPSAVAKQPPAALFTAVEGREWSTLPPPAQTLPAGLVLRELRALTWQGQPYWLVQQPDGQGRYFHAVSGQPADLGATMAATLARHYTGESTAAVQVSLITGFSDEYPFVNRHLPVWRVAFDRPDGLVAFIEPRSLQLAGLSDHWKTRFSWLFSNLHSWKWWTHEPTRDAAMALCLLFTCVLVLSGVMRATAVVRRRSPLQRWHRVIGLTATLALLAWAGSGLLHVLVIDKTGNAAATHPLRLSMQAAALVQPAPAGMPPGARLLMLATPDGPFWYWQLLQPGAAGQAPALRERYVSAVSGEVTMPFDYIRALSAGVAGDALWLSVNAVTRFDDEYGFVQKRLPVYRLRFDTRDHLAIHVDPSDAAVASVVRDLDRLEGYSFALLHKAGWLDFLGRDGRDAVAGLFALLVFGLALAGLSFLRRPAGSE